MKKLAFLFIVITFSSCGPTYLGSNFREKLITVGESNAMINNYQSRNDAVTPSIDNSSFVFDNKVIRDYMTYLDSIYNNAVDYDNVDIEIGLGAKLIDGEMKQSLFIRPILKNQDNLKKSNNTRSSVTISDDDLIVLDMNDCCPR